MLTEEQSANKPLSLLARYLGSESAAEAERQQIRRRQREEVLHYRTGAFGVEGVEHEPAASSAVGDATLRAEVIELRETVAALRRELHALHAKLPALAEERTRYILAEELPEALSYLTRKESVNGQD